ncbi:replicative DNA helicase [Candidatus Pacearchaeota archaeon]|nr:replicative DNA helicase [Candidatus Pacearchaeota archaeon]
MKAQTNLEAEKTILGQIIMDNNVMLDISDKLLPQYFSASTNELIYRTMAEMYEDKKLIDLITIRAALPDVDTIYLFTLADNVITTRTAKHYAGMIKDLYVKRSILAHTDDIIRKIGDGKDAGDIVSETIDLFLDINCSKDDNIKHIKSILKATTKQIEAANINKGMSGIPSGLIDLDNILCGFKTKFYVLAGRPGTGKTALALNAAANCGMSGGKVLIFELEMPDEEVGIRFISGEARINNRNLENGVVRDNEWGKLMKSCDHLSKTDIYIDDSSSQTDMDIWAKAKRHQAKFGLDIVIIDYLQLVKSAKKLNRREEVEEISRNFKKMSKDLGVPVVALAQLSRACEQEGRKPRLSDLREAGGIEQDADVVIFTHHPHSLDENAPEDIMEAMIAKHRGGPKGIVDLHWTPEFTRFSDTGRRYE